MTPVARTAAPPPVPLPPAVPWPRWNTPQTLWASLYLIWGLDALLLIAAIFCAQVHREAMQIIGKDTAPSIIAAQHIKASLADMDANAANELLGDVAANGNSYENARKDAATSLIEAAKNITYGKAEQDPIEAIQVAMGTYQGRVQRARDRREDAGKNETSYVEDYREAAKVMDRTLLPQADLLDKANHDVLESAYEAQSAKSMVTVVLMLAAGAALIVALVAVQKYLDSRMHRILNPLLLATTFIALGFVLYTFSKSANERHDLKVAKEDAFDSIHALWRAKAVAYAANADESRFLLDTAHAPEHEDAFFKKANLLGIPSQMDLKDASAAKNENGYLFDELRNITFEGESEAAMQSLSAFSAYLTIDKEIRRLQKSSKPGDKAEALRLCVGTKPGESNYAFDQFDQALDKTRKINQEQFDDAVKRGFEALEYFEWKAAGIAVIIALLAFFGILQRIREYQ